MTKKVDNGETPKKVVDTSKVSKAVGNGGYADVTEPEYVPGSTPLDMDQKVKVYSIAGWVTSFKRIESLGDAIITPSGFITLARSEIISQVNSGNKLFTGIDSLGGHATLFIDDAPTRIEVGFDAPDENRVQNILNNDKVKQLFENKRIDVFEKALKEIVVTRAEKYAIIEMIKKNKINDFDKIRIVENYTGFRL